MIYLSHRIREKAICATFSALFFTEGLTRIASFIVVGLLLSSQVWIAYFAALPIMLGALYLGGRVHVGLSQAQMTRLVGVLLLVSSVSVIRPERMSGLDHCIFNPVRLRAWRQVRLIVLGACTAASLWHAGDSQRDRGSNQPAGIAAGI
jgi:hypothetical protein